MANLQATIDRIEESLAVIAFSDGQKLNVSIGKLPHDCKQGDVLDFEIAKNADASVKNQELARDVLNEILNETGKI